MSKTVEIMVNKEKYVLMCIDIIKMPVELLPHVGSEYAEAELLRLIGLTNA